MSRPSSKIELKDYLVENYYQNEHEAEHAVKLGIVSVNNKIVKRIGIKVNPSEDIIKIIGNTRLFVSRGGYKLQKALDLFNIKINGRVCLDIGASTGGFTDCMLQYAAKYVYAIDTGYGQLDWGLRKNEKVKVIERTNVRYLTPNQLYIGTESPEKANFIAVDVSFISILKILPALQSLSAGINQTDFVFLIKPQFEAAKDSIGRTGVIRNPQLHKEILMSFIQGCFRAGLDLQQLSFSPILGGAGNIEFIGHFIWPERGHSLNPLLEQLVDNVIKQGYIELGV